MLTQRDILTVDDLVKHSGLELTLVGGFAGSGAVIDTLYIGDLVDPLQWMAPGSLLLTTGRVFLDDPEVGSRLLSKLHENGMPGMCVAITPFIDQIDPVMIQTADELGIALIEVPKDTPFRAVTEYVHDVLASRDLRRLRQSLSLQNQLMESFSNGGRQGLLRRLSHLTDGPSLVFDLTGKLLVQAGRIEALNPSKLWDAYVQTVAAGLPRSFFHLEGSGVGFREVMRGGAVAEVLMAVLRAGVGMEELPEAAVTFTHRLLELEQRSEEAVLGRRRTEREEVLRSLLRSEHVDAQLELRLGLLGLVRRDRWYAFTITVPDERSLPPSAARLANALLERERVPFLSLAEPELFVAVVEAEHVPAHVLGNRLARMLHTGASVAAGYYVGACGPTRGVDDVSTTVTHALDATTLARLLEPSVEDTVWFSSLKPFTRVIAELPDDQLTTLADAVLLPLRTHDAEVGGELQRTLAQYFIHRCSTVAAAEAMYLHRNALRKRLAKIESLAELDLSRADGIAAAFAALVASTILDTRRRLSLD